MTTRAQEKKSELQQGRDAKKQALERRRTSPTDARVVEQNESYLRDQHRHLRSVAVDPLRAAALRNSRLNRPEINAFNEDHNLNIQESYY